MVVICHFLGRGGGGAVVQRREVKIVRKKESIKLVRGEGHCTLDGVQRILFYRSLTSLGCLGERQSP